METAGEQKRGQAVKERRRRAYNAGVRILRRLPSAIQITVFLLVAQLVVAQQPPNGPPEAKSNEYPFGEETGLFTLDREAVVRRDLRKKQKVQAELFVTGVCLSDAGRRDLLQRALKEGHNLRPHPDQHPLYCLWNNREKSVITEVELQKGLRKNIADLRSWSR